MPSLCTVLSGCWEEVMCRHSFPGAPVPGDLGWNSGSCVSWHSMARLQPCTEVVSCTALSALCSAYSGAGSRPSLRLCRPPLVVARGKERAQPPTEIQEPQPATAYGDPKQPSSCNQSRCILLPESQGCQPSTLRHNQQNQSSCSHRCQCQQSS